MSRHTGKALPVSNAESLPLIRIAKREEPSDVSAALNPAVVTSQASGKYHKNHHGRPYLDIVNKRGGQWIGASVEIDIVTDSGATFNVNPGQMETWSRSAGKDYYVSVLNPGGKSFNLRVRKTLGDNYIDVYEDHFETDMDYYQY